MVSNGRGKNWGAVRGSAQTDTWRTVLISTGEAALRCFGAKGRGGAVMRTLEIEGSPFGGKTGANAEVVAALERELQANYGHAGPEFVRYVLRHRLQWPEWRGEHEALARYYRAISTTEEGYRLASYAAAIDFAGYLAHSALQLPWERGSAVELLWEELTGSAQDAAGDREALAYIAGWASANKPRFVDPEYGYPVEPSNMAGR
jgi:putative DNA primase/helicase